MHRVRRARALQWRTTEAAAAAAAAARHPPVRMWLMSVVLPACTASQQYVQGLSGGGRGAR